MNPQLLELSPYIRVEDPGGKKVKDGEDEDRDDVQRPMVVFQAEKTGYYRIVAGSFDKTGFYSLEIRQLRPGEPEPKKQYNSINSYNQLTNNDAEDKVREGCRHKVQTYRMKAGVKYVLDALGQQNNNVWLDVCLRLENSKGKVLAQDDLSGGNDDPRIVYVPQETATYNIIVVTEKPGVLGNYTLLARGLRPGESLP